MLRIFCFLLILYSLPLVAWAQHHRLNGRVLELDEQGREQALAGARVYQPGARSGALTDDKGEFFLTLDDSLPHVLVTNYVGYINDTLRLQMDVKVVQVVMRNTRSTQELEITSRMPPSFVLHRATRKTEVLTAKELSKAACCNLGESFETNPTVDVSFSDAVTGAKQIQMLGLAGTYTQLTTESLPIIQGLGKTYGLNYVPGPWVESISVSKGTGSVVNGYEAIAGQVNVELKKPETERRHLNFYLNELGRIEGNLVLGGKLKSKSPWGTVLLVHASDVGGIIDRNADGFADIPLSTQVNIANRWKYVGSKGIVLQFGVSGLYEDRKAGQTAFLRSRDATVQDVSYGIGIRTRRAEVFGKLGYIWAGKPYRGLGLQASALLHKQDGFYGVRSYYGQSLPEGPTLPGHLPHSAYTTRLYDGQQRRAYANLIYQDIIGNTNHSYRAGASLLVDDYRESFTSLTPTRTERVPGVFVEYTYNFLEQFTLEAGLRLDAHNIYGLLTSPRLHLRYALTERTILRASAGRGYRTANIFAENSAMLASSRLVVVRDVLDIERAWTYGISLTQNFTLAGRSGGFGVDVYRTDFEQQVVADWDEDMQRVFFYNLNGRSFATSVQLDVHHELLPRLDAKAAYKFYDVRTTMAGQLLRRQMQPQHRAFANLAYEVSRWKFDATWQWYGPQRLMRTVHNPPEFQQPDEAPGYSLVNAQVTKIIGRWEWYVGAENLLHFRQPTPIISADAPFGPYFDSSFAWGPVVGRTIYSGVRYSLK